MVMEGKRVIRKEIGTGEHNIEGRDEHDDRSGIANLLPLPNG